MSCCDIGAFEAMNEAQRTEGNDAALAGLSRKLADGTEQLEFAVPDAHCAACIRSIEAGLGTLPQVKLARVNLSRRRVRIVYDPGRGRRSELSAAINASGYHNYVLDPSQDEVGDPVLSELVKALAVAGFAAGNIMLFSVSIWAGANEATRDLFHWISALIALPAIGYSGRIFFRSAWRALRVGRTNMDVPISIGITLATALSLFETLRSGEHAYFDASTMLLFFLLIGRTLDHLMRQRARNAITSLARLQPRGASVVMPDGSREYRPLEEIKPGLVLELRSGDRVPVDGRVIGDAAAFDYSVVSGETAPRVIADGAEIVAGAINVGRVAQMQVTRPAETSYLSQMIAMMEAAEQGKSRQRRIADRAAAIYAPTVHAVAIATFIGWGVATGDWHNALVNAVAVLIITCPCALALAVPIVHVVAAGLLFERGIMLKDGAALERAAQVDAVAFDKTGTLTRGQPRLVQMVEAAGESIGIGASLAAASSHPLSRAIAASIGPGTPLAAPPTEVAGRGMLFRDGQTVWKLGSAAWTGVPQADSDLTAVYLTRDGKLQASFRFDDDIRADAADAVSRLQDMHLPVRLLSGDTSAAVSRVANIVGIDDARAELSPEAKMRIVAQDRTMMVGDGINDAPALRAAYTSMAPSSATDIGRQAADFVFTSGRLTSVPFAIRTARRASALVTQNLAIAIAYNALAVPLAISGQVTPLLAAVAMSTSSLVVVSNGLRLRWGRQATDVRAPIALAEAA